MACVNELEMWVAKYGEENRKLLIDALDFRDEILSKVQVDSFDTQKYLDHIFALRARQ